MREAFRSEEGKLIRRLAFFGLISRRPSGRFPGWPLFPAFRFRDTWRLFFCFSALHFFRPSILKAAGTTSARLVPGRACGETAYLGTSYLKNAGARVAISAGALITAIALFSALVIMVHSFRETVSTWVNQSINGDLYVRAKMSDINRYRDPLPPEIAAELEKLRNEADLVPYRRIFLNHGGVPYLLEPIDTDSYMRRSGFIFIEGDPGEAAPALNEGKGVIVSEVFSNQTGLRVGDTVQSGCGIR